MSTPDPWIIKPLVVTEEDRKFFETMQAIIEKQKDFYTWFDVPASFFTDKAH